MWTIHENNSHAVVVFDYDNCALIGVTVYPSYSEANTAADKFNAETENAYISAEVHPVENIEVLIRVSS